MSLDLMANDLSSSSTLKFGSRLNTSYAAKGRCPLVLYDSTVRSALTVYAGGSEGEGKGGGKGSGGLKVG